MEVGKPNLDVFAETLCELARTDRNLIVVTSDSRGSARLANFFREFPDQTVEVGIAEQNLVGVAAGLAIAGKTVFAVSPASFLTARALEQIKNDVAYANLPVRLVGISAGVSYGALGSTHHSLHDLAVLQAVNNIDIAVPADNFETRKVVLAAYRADRPVYLRFGKRPMPGLPSDGKEMPYGQARVLQQGVDCTLLCTGEVVWRGYQAAQLLKEQGLSCGVISLPYIRPFDEETILQSAYQSKAIISVEEHSVMGGIGSRTAALLMENGVFRRMSIMGIPDEASVNGSQEDIFRYYGLTPEGIVNRALKLLEKEVVR
jgi:transketolase